MSPKEELSAFVHEHVGEEHRASLSKLVAVFVADAVRADRAKRAEDDAQRERAREAVRRVNNINDPLGMKRFDFGSIFGGRSR